MTVQISDIDRIMSELEPVEAVDWLDREDISIEAIRWLVKAAEASLEGKYSSGMKESFIFFDTIAAAFMVGWECGREYGRRSRR